ncbi:unnamed protein product [Pocillopora meandrina]|uniref:Uncharacterized protein n=1 Tax=Pocillopora meandrina TaxID=46732 RepID=A0AAU9XI44_9CNID|nr:unnamed protein product [Pocillopora meandrina]
MNQRRTESTLSLNRQSELQAEYKNDLRDGRRVDAVELIEKKLKRGRSQHLSEEEQLKAYRLACYIFEVICLLCKISTRSLSMSSQDSFTSFFTFFQLSYECAVEARSGFLSYYSSLLDTLVTDAPCVGLGDGTYKVYSKDVPQDCISEVMVLVKVAAQKENLNLEGLVVKRELKAKWKEHKRKRKSFQALIKASKRN